MTTKAPAHPGTQAPPRPRIDPRIRQRRIEVQRDQGRARLRRLAVGAVAVSLVVATCWLAFTPVLDVDHIAVRGATNTGERAVIEALGIERGDALLTANVNRAARTLATLPWVETATVRRSWPGTVRVEIVERTPVAAIAARGGGWVLVDEGGRELAVQREPSIDLVRVAGRPIKPKPGVSAGDAYRAALDLASAIPPSQRAVLPSLWPKRDGTVEATVALPGGTTAVARFGSGTQLEAKLVALASVLERADLTGLRIIDLRVPGAPALTRG